MTAAVLDLEHDLHRARRAAVLEETRDTAEPAAGLAPSRSLVSSSAAAAPMHAAQDDAAVLASGPTPVADLSAARLRSIVAGARQARGPHRVRWENRERRAWDELAKRGQAA